MKSSVLVTIVTVVPALSGLAQGPLNPPGPPAPAMKTLEQTEPRIPIDSLPINITTRGSYYFTKDLHFTGSGAAIFVDAPNVTIDLMGYTLSSAADVAGQGIHIGQNATGCTIKNGSIIGTSTVTITGSGANRSWDVTRGGFSHGIFAPFGGSHRVLDVTVARCRNGGFNFNDVNPGIVTRCVAYENGAYGLTGGVITESSAFRNAGTGISGGGGVVEASRAYDNSGTGISGQVVTNSLALNNGESGIIGYKVENCLAASNRNHGIEARTGSRGSFIKNNQCATNLGAGIRFSDDGPRIEGNNCYENTFGIQSTVGANGFIVRNSCRGNGGTPTNTGASGNFDFDRSTNTYGPVVVVNGDLSANAAASHPAANVQY